MPKELSRDDFRNLALKRDGYRCVLCGSSESVVVHHIIERRLFGDSLGYFLDNAATVCEPCHIRCEQTLVSPEEVRTAAGITETVLPEHLDADTPWDKWGNPCFADGTRGKGELFSDESVQKILKAGGVLDRFRNRYKYPRTFHLPYSPGATSDDKVQHDLSRLLEGEVVVTEKMDGENTTLYQDHFHARSLDGHGNGPGRSWIKQFHAQIAHDIPLHWRVCGENLYARHSLGYENLPSYFLLFSIWNEQNECLSWDETVEWAGLLGLHTVPVLYQGRWDGKRVATWEPGFGVAREGYVVRVARRFRYRDFSACCAKWVRAGHVTTDTHWRNAPVVPNKLRGEA